MTFVSERLAAPQLLALYLVIVIVGTAALLVLGILSIVTSTANRRRELTAELIRELVNAGFNADGVRLTVAAMERRVDDEVAAKFSNGKLATISRILYEEA